MQILVKTIQGKTITIEASPRDSVEHIKRLISRKEGISEDQIYLRTGTRYLEDSKSLEDYKIQAQSLLEIGLRNNMPTHWDPKICVEVGQVLHEVAPQNGPATVKFLKEIIRYFEAFGISKKHISFEGEPIDEEILLHGADGDTLELTVSQLTADKMLINQRKLNGYEDDEISDPSYEQLPLGDQHQQHESPRLTDVSEMKTEFDMNSTSNSTKTTPTSKQSKLNPDAPAFTPSSNRTYSNHLPYQENERGGFIYTSNMEILSHILRNYYRDHQASEHVRRVRDQAYEFLQQSNFVNCSDFSLDFSHVEFIRFGSSTFALDSNSSDLDVCVRVGQAAIPTYQEAKSMLLSFVPHAALKKKDMILTARVPRLRLEYKDDESGTIVNIDVSILRNDIELRKAPYIVQICKDQRIPAYLFAIKHIVTNKGICNSFEGTLNSYTWTTLGLFVLRVSYNFNIPENINCADMLYEFFRVFSCFNPRDQKIVFDNGCFMERDPSDSAYKFVVHGILGPDENLGRNVDEKGLEKLMNFFSMSHQYMKQHLKQKLPDNLTFDSFLQLMYAEK